MLPGWGIGTWPRSGLSAWALLPEPLIPITSTSTASTKSHPKKGQILQQGQ
jgi:hypothetical protein